MKILVTGSAGYIGSALCPYLRSAGHEVYGLDIPGADFTASIVDDTALFGVFSTHDFDAVIHLAALSQIGESERNPAHYWTANVVGTLRLLECARGKVSRFVLASSCAVYGDSVYGATKQACEDMLRSYGVYGLSGAALRLFNVVGGASHTHAARNRLIPRALSVAKGDCSKLMVYGNDYDTPDGTAIRDYVHLDDVVRAFEDALHGEEYKAYDVGSGMGYSVLQVVDLCERVTGQKIPVEYGNRRTGDAAEAFAHLFGYCAEFSLEDAIRSAWEHAR